MRNYLAILKLRQAQLLLFSAFPARLAYGMIGLGTYFKVHAATNSISVAGLAVGLEGLSSAVTAGLRGSIIDRLGMKWPLRVFVPMYATTILIFNLGQTKTQLLTLAFILGFTAPPINLSVRPMWKLAVPPDLIRTAYAVDTSMMNISAVIGPVLVTALALSAHPERALEVCAGCMYLGGGAMASLRLTRNWIPELKVKGELPIWRIPGFRLLIIEGAFIGLGMGAFQIGIPAAATLAGKAHFAGTVFGTLAASSVFGGLIAGLISKRTSSLRAFRIVYIGWAIASIPLALLHPDWKLLIIVGALGAINGAQHVFYWEITEAIRPRGSAVAALGWLWTIEGTFTAFGNSIGGVISQSLSPHWCLALTTLCIFAGFATINIGRGRLEAADRMPTEEEDMEALADVISAVDTNL